GAEQERRHDAEVAATTSHGPEEVGVLPLAGWAAPAVSRDNAALEQVVDRKAVAAREVADPPPSVRPPTPVVEMNPLGTASPKACVAGSMSPHTEPPAPRTGRLGGPAR